MIKPLNDQVALLVEKEEAGSLFLSITDAPKYATVHAVGNGYLSANGTLIPLTVKVGDIVVLPQGDLPIHKIGGKEIIFLRERDLLAIISKDEI